MTANPQPNPNQPPMSPPSSAPSGQKIRRLAEATSVYCRSIVRMAFWSLVTVASLAVIVGLGYLAVRLVTWFLNLVSTVLAL